MLQCPKSRRAQGKELPAGPQAAQDRRAGLWLRGVREDAQLEFSSPFLPSLAPFSMEKGPVVPVPLPPCSSRDLGRASPGNPHCHRCIPCSSPGKFGSDIPQVSSRAFCEPPLPDSKQQMVLFTQEIRLFIFQSHRHSQCRVWSSLNNEPSGELVFLFVSFS